MRRNRRLALLDQQALMPAKPPRVVTAALVLPVGMLEDDIPAVGADPRHGNQGRRTPRRRPRARDRETSSAAPPSSRRSTTRDSTSCPPHPAARTHRIEVKARLAGAEDFFVTHNEVLTALNSASPLPPRACQRRPTRPRARRRPLPREPFACFDPATSTRPACGATGTRRGRKAGIRSEVRTTRSHNNV